MSPPGITHVQINRDTISLNFKHTGNLNIVPILARGIYIATLLVFKIIEFELPFTGKINFRIIGLQGGCHRQAVNLIYRRVLPARVVIRPDG